MDTDSVAIRGYQPADLDDLYAICLRTGDSGRDATPLFRNPRLPGEIFAAPYGVFEPDFAFVAVDGAGVGGYVLGALDTVAFDDRLEHDWWPALRARYPQPSLAAAAGLSAQERAALHNIHHPFRASADLSARFPSHLHIDLLPRLQGRGVGRRMMTTLTAALRARGSRGVHLFVMRSNDRAVEFYRRLGLMEIAADAVGRVFALDFTNPEPGAAGPAGSS
jgi:ribosomal protein S18 acetylase RimI-like enzyme